MTDLAQVLPDFPVAQYARLLPAIEKSKLTVTDLLILEVPEIGKRTQLPLLDIKRLCGAVLAALHADLGVGGADEGDDGGGAQGSLRQTGTQLLARPWRTISTLDASLDAALGGGVPTGCITEITGESGAGKTQLLLTLLLAVQLPPPRGLGRPALYLSTEAALSTKRLSQILAQHPLLRGLGADGGPAQARPSLDGVVSAATPDLESQDHILTYQVPVEVARRNVGLVVLDSVAANYRAEFERGGGSGGGSGGSNMAARGAELARLGHLLRDLAQRHDLAVVVANQVADRFSTPGPLAHSQPYHSSSPAIKSGGTPVPRRRVPVVMSQESPLASRSRRIANPSTAGPASSTRRQQHDDDKNDDADPSRGGGGRGRGAEEEKEEEEEDMAVRSSMPEPPPEDFAPAAPAALALDHQQRWFTGWGDDPYHHLHDHGALKTPSLGLVWSTQIAARVALLRRPAYGRKVVVGGAGDHEEGGEGTLPYIRSWRRWMKVVFAPHVPGTGPGLEGAVEFEVVAGGLRGVERTKNKKKVRSTGD
ncbi:DNA repair protein RAD57 [Xylaria palmicola]|nr:DNA repair protein RAD57 [Xylaria palmicola]